MNGVGGRFTPALLVLLAAAPLFGAGHSPVLPQPRVVEYSDGRLSLRNLSVSFASSPSPEDRFAAEQLAQFLSIAAGATIPVRERASRTIVFKRTESDAPLPGTSEQPGPDSRESYRINITPAGGSVEARSSAGLYYAAQTLRQMIEGRGTEAALPVAVVNDWPVLPYRGYMMDMSHGPLFKTAEVERQIDLLARFKGNQYYFYSEMSIELQGYGLVNPDARYSQDDVRHIVEYARQRHVDVVPCVELFGHLHDLFRVERYSTLSTYRYGGDFNPADPRVKLILRDWIAQLAALFPSPWFHVGFDEPWSLETLGAKASGQPPARLYIDHLKSVGEIVREHQKRLMFWADVQTGARIFSRFPELLKELPPDVVAVPWDYRSGKGFADSLEPLVKASIPQMVASGLDAWNEIAPDFDRTFDNVDGLVADGRTHHAMGLIHTAWTDDATPLYRMASPGIAYGAVAAWQDAAIKHDDFFAAYSAQQHAPAAAGDVAAGLRALADSETLFSKALGANTFRLLWTDPFAPSRIARIGREIETIRKARLRAEDAQECFQRALAADPESLDLPALLLGARLLDYYGAKNLFANEIVRYFDELKNKPTAEMKRLLLRYQAANRDHGFLEDLMDSISGLREQYREAWLKEYMPYRMGTAVGRFDGEFAFWREMQARFGELLDQSPDDQPLPPFDNFRPKR